MSSFNRAELSAVMVLPFIAGLMLNLPVVCALIGGSFAAVSAVIAAVLYILLLAMANTVIKKNGGKVPLSKAAKTALSICLLFFAAERLYMISQATSHLLLPKSHTLLLAAVMAAVAALVAIGRSEPCASVCSIILWPTVAVNVIVFLVGGGLYSVNNILPYSWSIGGVTAAAVALLSYMCEGLVMVLLCCNSIEANDFKAASKRAGILVSVTTVLFIALYSLASPIQSGGTDKFGVAELARNLQLGSFFQRMEGVYLFAAVIAATVSIALAVSVCVKTALQFVRPNKTKMKVATVAITLTVFLLSAVGGYGKFSAFNLLTIINCSMIAVIILVLAISAARTLGKRRVAAAAMAVVLLMGFCGCADYSETDNDVNAAFVSVDRAEEGYSFGIKTIGGEVFEISADSLQAAVDRFAGKSARRLRLMHVGAVIIAAGCAEAVTDGLIDELASHREIKSSAMVMVTDGTAKDILNIKTLDNSALKLIENNIKSSAESVHCTAGDLYSATCCRGMITAAPVITAENGNYTLGGSYLFGANLLLSGDNTAAYNLMHKRISDRPFDDNAVLNSSSDVNLVDDTAVITVKIKTRDYKGSREELATKIKEYCRPLLTICEQKKIDLFAVEEHFMRQKLSGKYDNTLWQSKLSDIKYELIVDID